jgi:hypothetical protein
VSRWSIAIGGAVALAATSVTVWLSSLPIASVTSEDAVLRLAFRARPERIETCVEQNPETLAALPPHMRQARICEGRTASYRLEVRRDGVLIAEHLVHGGGLRQDRPLYVFHEVPIPVGDASIAITFERQVDEDESGDRAKSTDLRQAVPDELTFERRVRFAPREVILVSYDPDRRALYAVEPP